MAKCEEKDRPSASNYINSIDEIQPGDIVVLVRDDRSDQNTGQYQSFRKPFPSQ
jgi:hypothetical protein